MGGDKEKWTANMNIKNKKKKKLIARPPDLHSFILSFINNQSIKRKRPTTHGLTN